MRHRVLFTAIIATLIVVATPELRAQQICKSSDYHGVFSAVVLGEFVEPPPGVPRGPSARIARVETDGNGNATIKAVLSLNGVIAPENYGGVYTVNPDCTMDVTLFVPFPGAPQPIPFHFNGMLADGGREVALLLLDPPGTTFRIILRKQMRANCTDHDLGGSFALNMYGTNVFQFGSLPGPIARVGKVSFDGNGGFAATTQVSYQGAVQSEALAGVYIVNSDCTFTMSYSRGGLQFTWSGMLSDYSSGANLLLSDPPGTVITGTLRLQ